MLAVLTGPVRSGKSSVGLQLALASGRPVVVAVGGRADDEEMTRRIERHQAVRPAEVDVLEVGSQPWFDEVPADACLLVDCLGTVLGARLWDLVPDAQEVLSASAEDAADGLADELVSWLADRPGPTVVVTNEVGWGIVPATPAGRLFRDVIGRANRCLVERAAASWLVVSGRCIALSELPQEVSWPQI